MSAAGHRVLWTLIGVLLVALGGAGIAASYGHLPGTDSGAPLLWSAFLDTWRAISPWNFVVAIALGLLVALLGMSLLSRVVRRPHRPAMDVVTLRDSGTASGADRAALAPDLPGHTRIRGTVLARGLERDLARDPQVHDVDVVLTGTAPTPEVWIDLHVGPRARLTALRDHVDAAVERFCRTSGMRPRHLDVTARIDRAGASRVR